MTTKLIYVFDSYCGWCYGLGPAIHDLDADEDIEIEVISGGLFSGRNAAPIGAFPHMPGANKRISDLTGVTFGANYQKVLKAGEMFLDSGAAAVGLVALKQASGGRDVDMAHAMQTVFYQDGLSLSDPKTYCLIAQDEGLDVNQVAALLDDPLTARKAAAERARAYELGVNSYPTLLAHTERGLTKIGSPVSSAKQLRTAVAALAN